MTEPETTVDSAIPFDEVVRLMDRSQPNWMPPVSKPYSRERDLAQLGDVMGGSSYSEYFDPEHFRYGSGVTPAILEKEGYKIPGHSVYSVISETDGNEVVQKITVPALQDGYLETALERFGATGKADLISWIAVAMRLKRQLIAFEMNDKVSCVIDIRPDPSADSAILDKIYSICTGPDIDPNNLSVKSANGLLILTLDKSKFYQSTGYSAGEIKKIERPPVMYSGPLWNTDTAIQAGFLQLKTHVDIDDTEFTDFVKRFFTFMDGYRVALSGIARRIESGEIEDPKETLNRFLELFLDIGNHALGKRLSHIIGSLGAEISERKSGRTYLIDEELIALYASANAAKAIFEALKRYQKMKPQLESVPVTDELEHAIQLAKALSLLRGSHGQALNIEIIGDPQEFVGKNYIGFRHILLPVIENIVDNAREKGGAQNIKLSLTPKMSIGGRNYIEIKIWNDGRQIPEDRLGQIYDPNIDKLESETSGIGSKLAMEMMRLQSPNIIDSYIIENVRDGVEVRIALELTENLTLP